VAEVNVGDQGGNAAAPGVGKIGQSDLHPANTDRASVDCAVERGNCCGGEQDGSPPWPVGLKVRHGGGEVEYPEQAGCEEEKINGTEPESSDPVEAAYDRVRKAKGEKRRGQEAHG